MYEILSLIGALSGVIAIAVSRSKGAWVPAPKGDINLNDAEGKITSTRRRSSIPRVL
jgi:hypothetical protein